MIQRLKPKSDFGRNVLTLMTGTTIAQAIPIAITPILTRLYTPEDFGVLAFFVAITMILGSVANARYELAIMLPKDNDEAINVAALGLLIASIFSLFLLILIISINSQIVKWLDNEEISIWLYFVPFVVLMLGLFNILNYLNTRKKRYKDIAIANIYKATFMASVQLTLNMVKSGSFGLVSGNVLSHIVANYRLAKNVASDFDLSKISMHEIKRLGKRYINFPKYSMWAILANNLSTHLTNILVSIYYSVATLGLYSLSQKILGLPSALIGSSIGQVYFQQAILEKHETGKVTKSFNTTFKKLFTLSILFFVPLYFIVEDLFAFIFGEEWRVAGSYAVILVPFYFIRFISSALSVTISIFEKNHVALVVNITILMTSIFLFLIEKDFKSFVFYLSIMLSVIYVAQLLYCFFLSRGKTFV